ncbi:hypothetical protein K502DRAFT_327289 [Neoconidiobolus thromboides FSU 785]|nr:hypothetical protein K502DRAFT_327289 [Neoconidiobolus thromboides FSU 785]
MRFTSLNLALFAVALSSVTSVVQFSKVRQFEKKEDGCSLEWKEEVQLYKPLQGKGPDAVDYSVMPAVIIPRRDDHPYGPRDKSLIYKIYGNSQKGVDNFIKTICTTIE